MDDYKTRMNEEVALMHKERFKKTLYEKIQEMSREEVAALLTRVYYSTFASVYMPRDVYEAKKEAFLKALDEPYEEEEDENEA